MLLLAMAAFTTCFPDKKYDLCLAGSDVANGLCGLCPDGCTNFTDWNFSGEANIALIGDVDITYSHNDELVIGMGGENVSLDAGVLRGVFLSSVSESATITFHNDFEGLTSGPMIHVLVEEPARIEFDTLNLNLNLTVASDVTFSSRLDANLIGLVSVVNGSSINVVLNEMQHLTFPVMNFWNESRMVVSNQDVLAKITIQVLYFDNCSDFPVVIPIRNEGLMNFSIGWFPGPEFSSVDVSFSTDALNIEKGLSQLLDVTFSTIEMSGGRKENVTFNPVLPAHGIFGFNEQENMVVLDYGADQFLHVRFDTLKVQNITNTVCHGDELQCAPYPKRMELGMQYSLDKFMPDYTVGLKIALCLPFSAPFNLSAVPTHIPLSIVGIDALVNLDVDADGGKYSGILCFQHVHLTFSTSHLDCGGNITILDCTWDPSRLYALFLTGAVTVDIHTFQDTDTILYRNIQSFCLVECDGTVPSLTFAEQEVAFTVLKSSTTHRISLNSLCKEIAIELAKTSLTLKTEPWTPHSTKKIGVTFSGVGTIKLDPTYNASVPELSPLVFDGQGLSLELSGVMNRPWMSIPADSDFTYSLPDSLKGAQRLDISGSVYPVHASSVTFTDNTKFEVIPATSEVTIDKVIITEGSSVEVSGVKIASSIIMTRGASLSPMNQDSTIEISDNTTIQMVWRTNDLPHIELNSPHTGKPSELLVDLDLRDEAFIDINLYTSTFYNKPWVIVSGIANNCEDWVKATRFRSVSPIFNGSTSQLVSMCQGGLRGTSSVAVMLPNPIPQATPKPSETPTPDIPTPNGLLILICIVVGFVLRTIALGVFAFCLKLKVTREGIMVQSFSEEESFDDDPEFDNRRTSYTL